MAKQNGIESQNDKILKWLKRGRRLTSLQALRLFGCLRLGSRICDLRTAGYTIHSRLVEIGEKRVAEYRMPRGTA